MALLRDGTMREGRADKGIVKEHRMDGAGEEPDPLARLI